MYSLYSGNGYMDTHVKNSQIMHFQYVGIISRNLIKQCRVRCDTLSKEKCRFIKVWEAEISKGTYLTEASLSSCCCKMNEQHISTLRQCPGL